MILVERSFVSASFRSRPLSIQRILTRKKPEVETSRNAYPLLISSLQVVDRAHCMYKKKRFQGFTSTVGHIIIRSSLRLRYVIHLFTQQQSCQKRNIEEQKPRKAAPTVIYFQVYINTSDSK